MPIAVDDAQYFVVRAKQERQRAEQSPNSSAQIVHLELAQLYEQRCSTPPAYEPPKSER